MANRVVNRNRKGRGRDPIGPEEAVEENGAAMAPQERRAASPLRREAGQRERTWHDEVRDVVDSPQAVE